jgi:NAD-dependent SIR2 family protein deacetylase
MVTNYPQQLSATTDVTHETSTRTSVAARVMGWIGQRLCGARGHDSVLHFEGNRVMMRCTSCGHDTPGWEISGRKPRQRFEGDKRRHVLTPHRLVLRKTA